MENQNNFDRAISYISPTLKRHLDCVTQEIKSETYEVRLRAARPVVLCGMYGTRFILPGGRVSELLSDSSLRCTTQDIENTFKAICAYSVHSNLNGIRNGYVTLKGGHRAGVCGTAASENGNVTGIRDISSVNLRISREFRNAALKGMSEITHPRLTSVIVAGAPSSGKTTFLRDVARRLADCSTGKYYKVVIADERGELAASLNGVPQYDVGVTTDVLTSYPKKDAVSVALRSMSPDVIVMDEVISDSELDAIETGVNSGVKFIVSVHAAEKKELLTRPQIKRLMQTYSFEKVLLLSSVEKPCTLEKVFLTEVLLNEIRGYSADFGFNGDAGALFGKTPEKEKENARAMSADG